jgi:hypothetical protein
MLAHTPGNIATGIQYFPGKAATKKAPYWTGKRIVYSLFILYTLAICLLFPLLVVKFLL